MLRQHTPSIEQEYTSNQDISRKKNNFNGKIKESRETKRKHKVKLKIKFKKS